MTHPMADGLMNVMAGMVPERSKTVRGSGYFARNLSEAQVVQMYRASFLPRRIVDTVAEDAIRRWRRISSTKAVIEAIEAEERRLRLSYYTERALQMARLLGGAAVYISVEGQHPSTPLDPTTVGKGGVRKLAMFTQSQIQRGELVDDVDDEWFGHPHHYILSLRNGRTVHIHPSRMAVFLGAPLPESDLTQPLATQWGDSVLEYMYEAIQIVDTILVGMSDLVLESKIDVVNIKGLMNRLQSDPTYEKTLIKRFTIAAANKGINGMLLLDEGEQYTQKSQTFGGLPEIIDRMFQYVSGACGIPVTRLFGTSPGGMNATGEADLRHYYDRVQTLQTNVVTPALAIIDECIERSATGTKSDSTFRVWNSLWQTTEKERSDAAEKYTIVAEKMVTSGMMTPEAAGEALVNTLTENETMPGLEQAYRTMGPLEPVEGPEEVSTPAQETPEDRRSKLRVVGADAASSLYVRRDVLNSEDILRWARSQGIPGLLSASDLHVTVLYSKTPVDWFQMGETWESSIEISAGGPRQVEVFGEGAVVLRFASNSLAWRHSEMIERGATSDYPEYAPHITVSYSGEGLDVSSVQPYTGKIVLGPEIFEPIGEDWKSRTLEAAE